jgi:hypothetical protein
MLRGDQHAQGLWPGAKPQRRVELQRFAADPGCDRAVGADLERWCRPLLHALVSIPGSAGFEHGDAEHARVQAWACAGGDRTAESVGVVADEHDRAGLVLVAVGAGETRVERISSGAATHRFTDR